MSIDQIMDKKAVSVSKMAGSLKGSEIIKLAGEINDKIRKGDRIFNFTIGDFDPAIFPIPERLKEEIIKAYQDNHTNYPAANGIAALRESASAFIQRYQGLNYSTDDFLIAGGARPLIYAVYQTILDPGDKVVFPVPSWNNNHYTHLSNASPVAVETFPENNFMPTAADLKPHLKGASILALCSPLNPTGTVFSGEGLKEICQLVLEENLSRPEGSKPLYILYDQIYWALTFGNTRHFDPVNLVPEVRPYTIFIDGISKSLAATGIRVGWAFGPSHIIDRMKNILGHIGAWAPKAEQVAAAAFLNDTAEVSSFLGTLKERITRRLNGLYDGIMNLKSEGIPIDAISPQAAIYLTVKFDLKGKTTTKGETLTDAGSIASYLLNEAGVAIVPFYAFGSSVDSPWFRISVGTCNSDQIPEVINAIRKALVQLQ